MERGREAGREEEGNRKDVKVMPGCLHPSVVCIYLDPGCRPLKGGLLAMPLSPPGCPDLISSHPWVNLCSFWKWVGPQWGHIPGDPIHRCVALLPTSLLTAGPESLNQIHGPDCCLSQARALPAAWQQHTSLHRLPTPPAHGTVTPETLPCSLQTHSPGSCGSVS